MKNITCLIFFLPFISQSQLNVTDYFVSNTTEIVELHVLPFDENRLVQISVGAQNPNAPFGAYFYDIIEITGSIAQPYVIPLCTDLFRPTFLENGILTRGEILNGGQELIYWDGTNLTTFDLDSLGDSNPLIQIIQGDVYVIATVQGESRAYKFDETTVSIQQISEHPESIEKIVASFNGDYFYQFSVLGSSIPTDMLWATDNAQSSTAGEIVLDITDPLITGNYSNWKSPIIKNGKMYLLQQFYSISNNADCNFRVISIEPDSIGDYVSSVLFEEDQVQGTGSADVFEWEGDLYYYRGGTNELYKSTDWATFQLEGVLTNGTLKEHYISENGSLYFIQYVLATDSDDVLEYTNGNFELRSGGRHLHILNEFDNKVFMSDWQFGNPSMVRVLDTQWDILDSAVIGLAGHSPVHNASVMFQDKFTFLYESGIQDVLQLDGVILGVKEEGLMPFDLFPNPISGGQTLSINTPVSGGYELMALDGKLVSSGNLIKGVNHLNSSVVQTGVYLFKINGITKRLVVN
jgi:hypothetical protein